MWCILDWARPGEVGTRKEWKEYISKRILKVRLLTSLRICLVLKHLLLAYCLIQGQAHDSNVEDLLWARVRASQLVRKILPHFFLRRFDPPNLVNERCSSLTMPLSETSKDQSTHRPSVAQEGRQGRSVLSGESSLSALVKGRDLTKRTSLNISD